MLMEEAQEVDGTGARWMLQASSSWKLNESRPWKHTSNNRTEVRAGLEMCAVEDHADLGRF
jgi:hypothetical protein